MARGVCRVCGVDATLALLIAVVLLAFTATRAYASIVTYTVTQVTQSELPRLPPDHWAQYKTMCDTPESAKTIPRFHPLTRAYQNITENMRFPFYAWEKTSWYVSDMGFLSPTPYDMCEKACPPRFFASLRGTLSFSDNMSALYEGGGDWPMIGLYIAPFRTTALHRMNSVVLTRLSEGDGDEEYTTVEYCSMRIAGATDPTQAALTAQVLVYTNGTIIMRYASLPDTSMLPEYMPSTGLIYSKTLRTVVPAPTRANGIAAYRFDPVFDACAGHDDVSLCMADTGNNCVWCTSTSACCASTFAAEVCPRGQWTTPASRKAAFPPQQFYNVTVDFDTPFIEMSAYNYSQALEKAAFHIFLDSGEERIPLFQTPSQSFLTCIPGASCPTQDEVHPCGIFQNMCANGNYTLSILALESDFTFESNAVWTVQWLRDRVRGEPLCSEAVGCARGAVGQLSGVAFTNSQLSRQLFSVQLYADVNGVIDIIIRCESCADGDPMLAYPPIRVGLVRYGVDDPSSVMIPQGLLRSGLHARFVPQSGCEDCGLNGWCDELSGTCHCRPGYYGSQCVACPVCWTGSECDDGINGSGACLCDGGVCEAACANTSSGGVPSRSCVGCDAVGGRCNCGVCECRDGWSGDGCSDAPTDACRAYSFDGCEVCGQHEGCVFCHDSTCFNPALSGTRDGYTCSYSTPAADKQACVTYDSLGLYPRLQKSVDFVAPIFLTFSVPVMLSLFVFVVLMSRRHFTRNSIHLLAVPGAPEFRRLWREREVVQGSFTRKRLSEREIMGIPLKQVSLRRLFKRRKDNAMNAK